MIQIFTVGFSKIFKTKASKSILRILAIMKMTRNEHFCKIFNFYLSLDYYTRPLQNAKVMAREKQGKVGEKVMSMGKNLLNNILTLNMPGGRGRNPPTGWFFPLLC